MQRHFHPEINGGLPSYLVFTITVLTTLTVANLHYNVSVLNLICHDLNIQQTEANLITVFTQGGYAVGLLFLVSLGDLLDTRKLILSHFVVLIASLTAFAMGKSLTVLLIASVVIGLSSVAVQLYLPLISAYSRPEEKTKAVSMAVSGLLIGVLLGRVAGGLVGNLWGWRSLYIGAAVLMMMCCVPVAYFFPTFSPTFKGTYGQLLRSLVHLVRKRPRVVSESLLAATSFASFQVMWACLAFHVTAAPLNGNSAIVGQLALCGLVAAVAVTYIGRYIERIGTFRVVITGLCLMLAAWGTLFEMGNNYTGLILGIVLIDVGQQFVGVSLQSRLLAIDSEATGRINTIYMTMLFIGATCGSFLAGRAWTTWGWNGVCACGAVFVMCCGALLYIKLKRNNTSV